MNPVPRLMAQEGCKIMRRITSLIGVVYFACDSLYTESFILLVTLCILSLVATVLLVIAVAFCFPHLEDICQRQAMDRNSCKWVSGVVFFFFKSEITLWLKFSVDNLSFEFSALG